MSAAADHGADRLRAPPWPVLLAMSATVAVSFGVLLYGVSVLVTRQGAGGDFSATVLSVGYGGALLVGGLLAPRVGRFADHRGVRPLFALGSVLGGLGMAVLAGAREPWQVLAAFWLLIGPAGAMTFYEPAFVAVDQWFGAARRARGLAVVTVIGGLAGPVFLPLTSQLLASIEWRRTAVALGALLVLVGLPAALVALPPRHRPPSDTDRSMLVTLRELAGDRRFVLYTISVALMFMAVQGILLHRIAVFEAGGFAVGVAAAGAAAASLLSFPGRAASPYLAQRFGGLRVQEWALAALAVSALAMVAASTAWQLGAHFLMFGLAFGAMLPLRAGVMSEWYSGSAYGRIMGSQWMVASLAGAAGPALVGTLRDLTGGYDVPAALLGATLAAALALTALSGRAARPNAGARVRPRPSPGWGQSQD